MAGALSEGSRVDLSMTPDARLPLPAQRASDRAV